MPLKLADLQTILYRLITAPGGPNDAAAQEHSLAASGLGAMLVGNKRLSASERVGIYANAYFYRLHDILREDFPCTFTILGEVNFHNLIRGYLVEYPPNEPSVLYAGRHLPLHLQTITRLPRISLSQWPFLADLARLERACIEVFHGPDADALKGTSLRDLAPESWPLLKLRLHPAAQILNIEWRIDTLMEAIKNKRPWEPPVRDSAAILVWRQDWQVHYRALEAGECTALKAAAEVSDFASICAALANELQSASEVSDLAPIISRMLTRWLDNGLLTTP
jgi:hypothetical protein